MKNTQYIRQAQYKNFDTAQYKKGIAPVVIAIVIALLAGGGYAVVKTNPGLAKKLGMEKHVEKREAEFLLVAQGAIRTLGIKTPEDCLSYQKKEDVNYVTYTVTKIFNSNCPGDATSAPTIPAIRIDKNTKSVYSMRLDGEFNLLIASEETTNWKTYKNEKYGFEFKYPNSYVIHAQDGSSISVMNSQRCDETFYQVRKKIPTGCWRIAASFQQRSEIGLVSGNDVKKEKSSLGGVEGQKMEFTSKYDFDDSQITIEAEKDKKWYSLGMNFYGGDEKNARLLFEQVLSSFKFTGKYIPTTPSSEQQSVLDYLRANITNILKAKPILGSTKWVVSGIAFYPSNKILVSFDDGHITGGFLGSYSTNSGKVSVTYIDEAINTGDEYKKLSEKYNLVSEKAVKYQQTPSSGFELIE